MSIIAEDDGDPDSTFARPWWFAPALVGVALGGLAGLAGMLVPPTPATRAAPIATASQPVATNVTPAPLRTPLNLGYSQRSPHQLTLQLPDLTPGFVLRASRDDSFDNGGEGYAGGWLAIYGRVGPTGTTSVISEVTWWRSIDDAQRALRSEIRAHTSAVELPSAPAIGDESHALELDARAGEKSFEIVFRVAAATNLVSVSGPEGAVDAATVVDLARHQLARFGAVPSFPSAVAPVRIFEHDDATDPRHSGSGSTARWRYLLHDDGMFELQVLGPALVEWGGVFTEANGVITFHWPDWGTWTATGTVDGDRLVVEYHARSNDVEFENATFVQVFP